MTLKTGGVGLNLVKASTVIHLDPWWNPAAEHQATDRAHRIGQKKSVQVYRYIMKDSLEERIQELKGYKQKLFDRLFGKVEVLADLGAAVNEAIDGADLSARGRLTLSDFERLVATAPRKEE